MATISNAVAIGPADEGGRNAHHSIPALASVLFCTCGSPDGTSATLTPSLEPVLTRRHHGVARLQPLIDEGAPVQRLRNA